MPELESNVAVVVGIALVAAALSAGTQAHATQSPAPGRTGFQPVQAAHTDAHKPVTCHFAVTNTADRPQTEEGVRVACPCQAAEDISGREIALGEALEFGVVEDGEARETRLELRGCAAQEARITGVEGPDRAVFRVEAEEVSEDKPQFAVRFWHERRQSRNMAVACAHGRTGFQPVREGMNALAARSTTTVRSSSAPSRADAAEIVSPMRRDGDIAPCHAAQSGGDVWPPYMFGIDLCNSTAQKNISYCNYNTLMDKIIGHGGYSHG